MSGWGAEAPPSGGLGRGSAELRLAVARGTSGEAQVQLHLLLLELLRESQRKKILRFCYFVDQISGLI